MIGDVESFLSLKALHGGGVSFGNDKKGYILGIGRIGKSLEHSIENVYYVNGLKHSLLSVSQIFDKGNEDKFNSKKCTVTNLTSQEVVLVAKRVKNMYVVDLDFVQSDELTRLSAITQYFQFWHLD
ncbi:MAG: hypothetical protein Q8853_02750, partial [Candidatus Phytoplasma australasiaticum]|nr:hypothetical protein [Candidatus Phytoplasma australasiaticum]